jgi:hypothetical protein
VSAVTALLPASRGAGGKTRHRQRAGCGGLSWLRWSGMGWVASDGQRALGALGALSLLAMFVQAPRCWRMLGFAARCGSANLLIWPWLAWNDGRRVPEGAWKKARATGCPVTTRAFSPHLCQRASLRSPRGPWGLLSCTRASFVILATGASHGHSSCPDCPAQPNTSP